MLFSQANIPISAVTTVAVEASSIHLNILQRPDTDGFTTSETSMGGRESLNGEFFSKFK
jgi:hypothetical protein